MIIQIPSVTELTNIRIILLFTALTLMLGAFGQNNSTIDSLENVLRTVKVDTAKVNCLNSLSSEYRKIGEYKMAMQYADSANELAITLDYKKGIADSYKWMGYVYKLQRNYQKALESFYASLEISEEIGDKKGIANIYKHIGNTYWIQGNRQKLLENRLEEVKIYKEIGDKKGVAEQYYWIGHHYEYHQCNYPEALESFIAALSVFKEIGDEKGIANCYNRIGNIYLSQGDLPEAMDNYMSSLKFFEEIGGKIGISNCYNNIAIIYEYQEDYQEALKNNFASLKIKEEIGFKRGITDSHHNIGNIYSKLGNYTDALKYSLTSLKISEEIRYDIGIVEACHSISSIYLAQGNYSEALEYSLTSLKISEEIGYKRYIAYSHHNIGNIYKNQGNYKDARKYLEDGLALSKKIGIKPLNRDSYQSLSKLDSAEGDFVQAMEHYKKYTLYKDSLFNEESNNEIALMKIQYETEKKDREIELLSKDKSLQEQQLEKQRLIRNGTIAGVALLLLVALLGFRSFRLRKKLEEQRAIAQERHRISADLHDDVGSGLSKITLLSELLKTQAKTPENRKEAEKISETALGLSSTISEIIWALNSNNDYLENMVAYIRRYAAEYFENSPVNLKISTSGEILPTPINGEHRRNIFYTVKEALNNILKHAEATEAELKFVVIDDKLDVVISDNGKGIPDGDPNRFGNGINNMRARMRSIAGDFKIESESHQGTRIFLNLAI